MMTPITSLNEIKKLKLDYLKGYGSFETNYLINANELTSAISNGLLSFIKEGSSIFIFYKTSHCYRLFYYSPTFQYLEADLKNLKIPFQYPVIMEKITNDLSSSFSSRPALILQKLTREVQNISYEPSNELLYASKNDVAEIENILINNFDPVLERVPDISELTSLCLNNEIALYKDLGKIKGLVIFCKKGAELHLRYWWVDSNFRNKRIGSRLLNEFFKIAIQSNSKKMTLFVDINNRNAINRYGHYGFHDDHTYDYIYKIQ